MAETRDQIIQTIRRVADEYAARFGVDPQAFRVLMIAAAEAESGIRVGARRPQNPAQDASYWPDTSNHVFQKIVRFMREYLEWSAANGHDPAVFPGTQILERFYALYANVEHDARVAAENLMGRFNDGTLENTDANLAKDLYEYNWPAGNEKPYSPAHEANYLRALAVARSIEGVSQPTPPKVTFNPNVPAIPQSASFDCSETSLLWVMHAFGRNTQDAWLESAMLHGADGGPRVMSADLGLLDHTGAGLAAFTKYHYRELGFDAGAMHYVSFDDVKAKVNSGLATFGVMIGGQVFNHWVAVRGYSPETDQLLLANSSNGHKGVFQEMNRAQFGALGKFSMVVVTHRDIAIDPPAAPPVVPPTTPPPSEVTALKAEIDRLKGKLGYLTHEVAAALRKEHDTIAASLGALAAAIDTLERHAE